MSLAGCGGGDGDETTEEPEETDEPPETTEPSETTAPGGPTPVDGGDISDVEPAASDSVLYWWPFNEGDGEAMGAEIDDTGDATGQVGGEGEIEWVEGDFIGGSAVRRPEGSDGYITTSTWGDFGSNMDGDFSLAVTFDLDTDGVLFGSRTFDSYNGLTIQMDGSAETRTGMYLRSDGLTSGVNDYVFGETEVVGNGRFRAVIVKESNDAENYRVYLNGEHDNTIVHNNGTEPDSFIDLDEPFTFFAYNNQGDPQRSPAGVMDDFIVYDKALSEDEVQADFERQPWDPDEVSDTGTPEPTDTEPESTPQEMDVVEPVGEPRYWWPFDEGEGDAVADNAGDADGTNNGAEWVGGPYQGGSALYGDGEEAHVETTTWDDFGSNMDGDFTICLTIDLEDQQGVFMGTRNEEIVHADPDARDDSLNGLVLQGDGGADGRPGMFLRADSDESVWDYVWGESDYVDEGIMRVAIKKETNDAENYGVYVDGEEDNTIVNGNDLEPDNFIDFDHPFTIFCYNGQGTKERHVKGVIDDVVVYDEALSDEDIQADFDRQHFA